MQKFSMKKVAVLLPGAIALMMAVSPMLAAHARPTNRLAQAPKQEYANKLGLTDAQKQSMKSIREAVQKDIYTNVLNDGQRAQYDAAVQRGEKPGKMMRSLNLSDAQKTQIRDKMRSAQQKINQEVLTQAQRDQIQQMRQQRRNRRGA
ncbi:MAG: hypothetical protein J0L70_00290 [Leptolyngbya sp. UWPOB_LEPTO1]|uniref:hypothetical protein n=1 Tax=Leptolyngbya sp. UWPOB_LEPTO1 TaxID=2815653 RepID=UPI001ACFFED1|nr:hypothetical protein [Leptolyngbya sp. UWPOB_LEPTO1]MBN8558941.1 hypothetical protein [Leptolyngbya sp. UWPOB_LEPTO1]